MLKSNHYQYYWIGFCENIIINDSHVELNYSYSFIFVVSTKKSHSSNKHPSTWLMSLVIFSMSKNAFCLSLNFYSTENNQKKNKNPNGARAHTHTHTDQRDLPLFAQGQKRIRKSLINWESFNFYSQFTWMNKTVQLV